MWYTLETQGTLISLFYFLANDMIHYHPYPFFPFYAYCDIFDSKVDKVPISKEDYVTFFEQFVHDVHGFSSQYGSSISISYTALNIVGAPSKFPDYGDFPQAFVMVLVYYYFVES